MDSSSQSRLILAGLVTAGVSSAALGILYYRRKAEHLSHTTQNTAIPLDDRSTTTFLRSAAIRTVKEDAEKTSRKAIKYQHNITGPRENVNYKGLTIVMSSPLTKIFVLARKAKSDGLNIIYWDRLIEADDRFNYQESSFAYGRYRFRSAQDLTTGRTFLLQKCASDLTVRCDVTNSTATPPADGVPPVSEIFPLSVLRKAGVCDDDPAFGDEDDAQQGSSPGFISKKSNGKIIRIIKARNQNQGQTVQTDENSVSLAGLQDMAIVRNYQPSNCPSGLGRLGSEFDGMYSRMYNDYHAVVTPNSSVVVFNSHTR